MTEEDRVLLARFRQAREKESQWKDKAVPHLRREEIRRLVTGLCCIFAILITLLVRLRLEKYSVYRTNVLCSQW